ncbi:FAD-dependent oxidoreductase [Nocardiopsis sp. CNT312]|uniref:flavin monoamine oxidase family protein n=1 Tax=Nocardiopsis sp. CNT312 TaxID=1137268 RepID=UPI0004BBCF5F|nr:FAD-dependent oxidoreductase [Nocardiopsis sp. CNT312]
MTDENPSHTIFPAEGGGHAEFSLEEGFGHQAELLLRYFEGTETVFPDAHDPFAAPRGIAALDQLAIQDRLDSLGLSTLDEAWLYSYTAGQGGTTNRGAFSQIAQWWALSDFDINTFYGVNSIRPQNGLTDVLQHMVDTSGADLRLNSPVRSVYHSRGRVTAVTRHRRVHCASAAVIAVPVNVWSDINFWPFLRSEFLQAGEDGYSVPVAKKFWVHLAGNIDRPIVNTEPGHLFSGLVPMDTTDRGILMTGFSCNPDLDTNDHTQISTAVTDLLPGSQVLEVRGHDWGGDRYALGGWTYKQPGQLTEETRVLRQRQGALAFATSDISTGWSGYVDGAMESGAHAARKILDWL